MKVSVIIPAYNCAPTIPDTVKSVLSQTLDEFEIIIVNDGSADNTLEVLSSLAAENDKIRIITVENGGPAAARNAGVAEASGEYIAFCDSDDLMSPDMLFEMYGAAHEHALDIVCCGYLTEHRKKDKIINTQTFTHPNIICETRSEFFSALPSLLGAHIMYAVWNKLYRRDMITRNSLFFPDALSGEDRLFNIRAFGFTERFGCISSPFYRYIFRGGGSLAGRYVSDRFETARLCHNGLLSQAESINALTDAFLTSENTEFIKNAMASVTQLCAPDCRLSRREKRAFVKIFLNTDEIKAAASVSRGLISKIVNATLKTSNITLTLLLGRGIYIMQSKLNPLYLRIKHKA